MVRENSEIFKTHPVPPVREGENIKMKNKTFIQDRIAMRIAARYGLVPEYKIARRHRYTPLEALQDWDMLLPGDYKLFDN